MAPKTKKASVEPQTGPSELVAEPAEAPATKVPEGTAEKGGDGGLGDDYASPAANFAAEQPLVS